MALDVQESLNPEAKLENYWLRNSERMAHIQSVQEKENERKKLGSELDRYTAFCIVRHWAAKFIQRPSLTFPTVPLSPAP